MSPQKQLTTYLVGRRLDGLLNVYDGKGTLIGGSDIDQVLSWISQRTNLEVEEFRMIWAVELDSSPSNQVEGLVS